MLSYRLCDRNYDCENCELYHALRGNPHRGDSPASPGTEPASVDAVAPQAENERSINSYICQLTSGCELHLDRPYCRCHFWLQRFSGDRIVLGLDAHLLRVLYPVKSITMPHAGVLLKRGEHCGWITRGRVTIPLSAPLTGKVTGVNETHFEKIRARGGLNGGDGWLLELRAHDDLDTVPGLYRGEQALIWYLNKVQLLKRYLREAAVSGADVSLGATMTDGGEPHLDLEQVLGRERFETLVDEMFRLHI